MCDTCYNRGYNDFPVRLGSVEHPDDYERGYSARQRETGEDGHSLDARGFCETCYNRGLDDAGTGIYGGPTTNVSGHKESYSKGYNEDNRRKEEQRREANEREQRKINEEKEYRRREKLREQEDENNHNRYRAPQKTWQEELIKVGLIIALIIGAIWLAVNVVLPLLIINLATLALICSFILKDKRNALNILSFLGAIYIFLDFNYGWLTKTLPEHVSTFTVAIPFFFYLNFLAGLIAGYFVIRDLLNKNFATDEDQSEFSKRNIIIIICLFIAGGTAIFFQKTFVLNAFSNTANVENIPSPSIPNSITNAAIQNSPLSYSKNYEGKAPADVKLFETDPLKTRLVKLLGDRYNTFISNMSKSTPIIIRNDALFTSGFLKEDSIGEEAAISILLNRNIILVGVVNKSKYKLYSEQGFTGELPHELRSWFDVTIKSTQDNLVRLHQYNYTGTVESVEEQGNRGMTYLSIKTIDGEDQSFLINGAKIYQDDNEVNSSKLIKGINVGIIGGDEAKRIDILNTSTNSETNDATLTIDTMTAPLSKSTVSGYTLRSGEYKKITGTCTDFVLMEFSNSDIKLNGVDAHGSKNIKYTEKYYKSSTDPNKYYLNNNTSGSFIIVYSDVIFNFVSTTRTCTYNAD